MPAVAEPNERGERAGERARMIRRMIHRRMILRRRLRRIHGTVVVDAEVMVPGDDGAEGDPGSARVHDDAAARVRERRGRAGAEREADASARGVPGSVAALAFPEGGAIVRDDVEAERRAVRAEDDDVAVADVAQRGAGLQGASALGKAAARPPEAVAHRGGGQCDRMCIYRVSPCRNERRDRPANSAVPLSTNTSSRLETHTQPAALSERIIGRALVSFRRGADGGDRARARTPTRARALPGRDSHTSSARAPRRS